MVMRTTGGEGCTARRRRTRSPAPRATLWTNASTRPPARSARRRSAPRRAVLRRAVLRGAVLRGAGGPRLGRRGSAGCSWRGGNRRIPGGVRSPRSVPSPRIGRIPPRLRRMLGSRCGRRPRSRRTYRPSTTTWTSSRTGRSSRNCRRPTTRTVRGPGLPYRRTTARGRPPVGVRKPGRERQQEAEQQPEPWSAGAPSPAPDRSPPASASRPRRVRAPGR